MEGALARFLRATAAPLLLAVFRVRVVGLDRVPTEGGALLAGNHVSYVDPVLLWCCLPRPVRFMAKAELWRNRVFAWLLPRIGAFPVRRGEADRTAIAVATDTLRAGVLVGIFPEGTRAGGDTGAVHDGAAFLALRAGVPVVPVGLVGTDRVWPRGRRLPRIAPVTIAFGEPLVSEGYEGRDRRGTMAELTSTVMDAIAAQVEEARSVHRAS